MTKMAAMPIYDKNLQKTSSPEPVDRFHHNLAWSIDDSSTTMYIKNHDPVMALTYFTARST